VLKKQTKEYKAKIKSLKKAQGLLRGRARGRLTPPGERLTMVTLIQAAMKDGCRLNAACNETEVSLRTFDVGYAVMKSP
jgi:hypothetical protein